MEARMKVTEATQIIMDMNWLWCPFVSNGLSGQGRQFHLLCKDHCVHYLFLAHILRQTKATA